MKNILILGCSFTAGSYQFLSKKLSKEVLSLSPELIPHDELILPRHGWWYFVDYFKDNDVTSLLFLASICKISCLGLFTSYWDGLNTFPYEYTLLDDETPGSLIISRFMGCYRCLPGVLSVNPLCLKNISEILNEGLTRSMERRKISHSLRSKYIIKHNFEYWANDFIKELFDISKNNSKKKYMEIGWGSNTKLIALDLSIEHLENSNYLSEFDISEILH